MKFARVLKINDSKDNAQRILTLAYNNIKKRKDGNWTGTPITVERSIYDIIPIDIALNESMLSPSILEKGKHIIIDENIGEIDENIFNDTDETVDESDKNTLGDITIDENIDETTLNDRNEGEIGNNDENSVEKMIDVEEKDTDDQHIKKGITKKEESGNKQTRKSEWIKKQRVEIHPDDIGDNDDEKDKNYK